MKYQIKNKETGYPVIEMADYQELLSIYSERFDNGKYEIVKVKTSSMQIFGKQIGN